MGVLFTADNFVCVPPAGNFAGSGAIISPQFAIGGGWTTQLTLVNESAVVSNGRVDVFDPSGRPMAVRLNGILQSTFPYSIPAAAQIVFAPVFD
jgi:hypothetical protein